LFEPLQSTRLHLVETAIARLLSLFPHDPAEGAEAAEYNRLTANEADRIRDFLIARYKTNGRLGEPFWDACRVMAVPDELAYRIELYRSRGAVVLYDGETFEPRDWISLFDEQGVRPRRHDPLADAIPVEQLDRHLARLREVIINGIRPMPTHAQYLSRHCAAAEGAAA
jgi:tryptophan halogenase